KPRSKGFEAVAPIGRPIFVKIEEGEQGRIERVSSAPVTGMVMRSSTITAGATGMSLIVNRTRPTARLFRGFLGLTRAAKQTILAGSKGFRGLLHRPASCFFEAASNTIHKRPHPLRRGTAWRFTFHIHVIRRVVERVRVEVQPAAKSARIFTCPRAGLG